MPYQWTESPDEDTLRLWPHQSLTAQGFSWFIGATAVMLALPLIAVLGSPVAWVLLVFFVAALLGVFRAVMANKSHLSMHEVLTLNDDRLHLSHVPSKGAPLEWEANPYWVNVRLHTRGKVENYLTLKGAGREVELGAFLSPDERKALYDELQARLKAA